MKQSRSLWIKEQHDSSIARRVTTERSLRTARLGPARLVTALGGTAIHGAGRKVHDHRAIMATYGRRPSRGDGRASTTAGGHARIAAKDVIVILG